VDDVAAVLDLIAEHAGWYARTRIADELSCPVG
jgi:L-2,4-diaminobutyrate decarboxylase